MEALAQKILVLGIDGMDPKFTKHCIQKGGMKNVQELIRRGSAREDLVMMGGQPTVTPVSYTHLGCMQKPPERVLWGSGCFYQYTQ